jgi:hypothetical protein
MHWPMTVTNCSEQCIVVLRSTFEEMSSKYLCGLKLVDPGWATLKLPYSDVPYRPYSQWTINMIQAAVNQIRALLEKLLRDVAKNLHVILKTCGLDWLSWT